MIQTYSKNLYGRDFICADIHGHFSLLQRILDDVKFDSSCDRLFSLGDLIDRGDDSIYVLDWLEKTWFHAIQGNHERMLINYFDHEDENIYFQWMMWGGDWAEGLSPEELRPYYDALSTLPIGIELELVDDRRVGLVHAELPNSCDWLQIKSYVDNVAAKDVERNTLTHEMLWKKSQPFSDPLVFPTIEPVENIDHVFHGHTIVQEYLRIGNRSFLDLGAYNNGRIGFIEPIEYLARLANVRL